MKKKSRQLPQKDPFAARESEKYADPIPSREFIMQHLTHSASPLRLQQIATKLHLTQPEKIEALRRRLKAMERDGQLIRNRRKEYGLAKKMNLIRGRVIGHPNGFGFLVPDDGGGDLLLPQREMRSLLHGDRALVTIASIDQRGRREGAVIEVLERAHTEIVGRFFNEKGVTFVEPHNRRISQNISIPPRARKGAKNGQIVVVQLVEQPSKHHPPIGKVIEVMGNENSPGMEIEISARSHEIPQTWPESVLQTVDALSDTVPAESIEGREDMRHIPFVTIDGEDARDFDDAVYCEPRGKGWLLLVAIADVSAYVKPQTDLDEEARKRGNSVYFPNHVIPMLPEKLSNGLCSLNPNVDRLSMVCEMAIDVHGRIRRTRYFESVIRSTARLTYTDVGKVLEGNKKGFKPRKILLQLENLHNLYLLLRRKREKRGAIDIETVEPRIIFDEQQKIQEITSVERNEAHKLIEEMMLAANLATAEWLTKQKMPLLYRIHEAPDEESLANLRTFLGELGLRLWGKDQPSASYYAKLLEKVKGRPDARLIQTVVLRSMKMAIYSQENKGHFGLAYPTYTHFTSPIRRYPDLMVHRAIRHRLQNKPVEKFLYSKDELHLLGEHCSMTERRADDATRDAIQALKCEYMKDKVGEVYSGLVTGVTAFGLFVELDGIFVEGLVHVTSLEDDYYHFDPIGHRLQGERTGKIYRLADRLQVKLVRVDLVERKMDFDLA